MKQLCLIVNGFARRSSFDSLYTALQGAAKARGLQLCTLPNTGLFPLLNRPTGQGGSAIFWDKDVRLARALEQGGWRLFNSSRAIELCDDKALTHLALMGKVPMPDTLPVPFSFPGVGYGEAAFLHRAGELLGWPMVIKECFGSFGMQVYLAEDFAGARAILERTAGSAAIMQRYVAESAGQDLRVYVVGGRAVAAMERRSETGFRANLAQQGSAGRAHELTPREAQIAELAAGELGLDFCGVDLLFSAEGPLLIEVNSNAHFAGITAATGVDIAGCIIEHVMRAEGL